MFINASTIHIKPFAITGLLCSLVNLSLAIFSTVSVSIFETAFFKSNHTSLNDLPDTHHKFYHILFPCLHHVETSLISVFLWCLSFSHHVPLWKAWLGLPDRYWTAANRSSQIPLPCQTSLFPSDSSHRACTLITWPSWWPSTECALLSCTGGPKLDTVF